MKKNGSGTINNLIIYKLSHMSFERSKFKRNVFVIRSKADTAQKNVQQQLNLAEANKFSLIFAQKNDTSK